jgi:hypothetical protein
MDKWIDLTEAKKIGAKHVDRRTIESWFLDRNKMFVKKKVERKVYRNYISKKAFLRVVEAYKNKLVNNA